MPYKDKHDPRYKKARMKWYYKNKLKHKATKKAIIYKKKEYLKELKKRPCADCGLSFPYYVMDFDHRDRSTKSFTVGLMFNNKGWKLIKEEVEKCDIVCANCHRIRTYKYLAHSSIG